MPLTEMVDCPKHWLALERKHLSTSNESPCVIVGKGTRYCPVCKKRVKWVAFVESGVRWLWRVVACENMHRFREEMGSRIDLDVSYKPLSQHSLKSLRKER